RQSAAASPRQTQGCVLTSCHFDASKKAAPAGVHNREERRLQSRRLGDITPDVNAEAVAIKYLLRLFRCCRLAAVHRQLHRTVKYVSDIFSIHHSSPVSDIEKLMCAWATPIAPAV